MRQMLRPGSEPRTEEGAGTFPVIDLQLTVREQVIPRLKRALEGTLAAPRHPVALMVARGGLDAATDELAERLLRSDVAAVTELIDALRRAGRNLCEIYLRLLAPVACRLRDLWSEDVCGLAEVTIALGNLQSILRHYASDFYSEAYRPETGLRALLLTPARDGSVADPHLFSALLLSEFFRRDGWEAWVERSFSSGRFRDTVLSGWFDVVEVLATSDRDLDEIASGIRLIRRGSPNPQVGVIVCGDVFREHPEFVRLVGADSAATDPVSSLTQANRFVTRPTHRRRLS